MLKIVIFLRSTLSVVVDIVYLMPVCSILEGSSHCTYRDVWYKERSHQGSTSRCWWRVRAQQEEETRSTRRLYRRLSYSVPLFCFLKFFTYSLFVTQYRTEEWENRKTERNILFYASERWKRRSGDKPALKVHSRFQSLGSNDCALRKRLKVVKYLKYPV
jgi:hypothetical protein